jgi:hypothetical protein
MEMTKLHVDYCQAKLPALQEVDVRYTEAWCAEDYTAPPRPPLPNNNE